MSDDAQNVHLYLTLDDTDPNNVLELVRVDSTGMYIRDNRQWVQINPDVDNPRVWDRQIVDVNLSGVDAFDNAEQLGVITRDNFTDTEIPDVM